MFHLTSLQEIGIRKNPDYYNVASGRDEEGNLITTLQAWKQFLDMRQS